MFTSGTGSFSKYIETFHYDRHWVDPNLLARREERYVSRSAGKMKFYIGDVCVPRSVTDAVPGIDYIFYAVAL